MDMLGRPMGLSLLTVVGLCLSNTRWLAAGHRDQCRTSPGRDRWRHLGSPRGYLTALGRALLCNELICSTEQVILAMPGQVLGPRDRAGLDCCPHGWRAPGPGGVTVPLGSVWAGASSRLASLVNTSGEAVVRGNEKRFLLLHSLVRQHDCSLQANVKDRRLCLWSHRA